MRIVGYRNLVLICNDLAIPTYVPSGFGGLGALDLRNGLELLDVLKMLDNLEVLDGLEVHKGLEVLDGRKVPDGLEVLDFMGPQYQEDSKQRYHRAGQPW